MVSALQGWPEPVVRVQSLSNSGISYIPECYVKPINDRPITISPSNQQELEANTNNNIPVIDLGNLYSNDIGLRKTTMDLIGDACSEWGMFQVINHGVNEELMREVRKVWREFFHLPLEMKQEYDNNPATYEGYGSRLGVEKEAKLDWSDYFFLHFLPLSTRNQTKWPTHPQSCRELVSEYNEQVLKVCEKLMKVFSLNLGLEEDYLENAFGGDQIGASLRVNFYPKCPQPDLTLGISPHSDPGGITVLLPDDHVSGLQIQLLKVIMDLLHTRHWRVAIDGFRPENKLGHAGVQFGSIYKLVISNAKYKSVEHRVVVSSNEERLSLAFFYNPKGDILIGPAKELLVDNEPPLYNPMTFNHYRSFIRLNGLHGKSQVESLKSPRQIDI